MVFKRVWDSSCPRVWNKWEADGKVWIIQDLDPADYEEAVHILTYHLCPDEDICIESGIMNDPVSLKYIGHYWLESFSHRVALGCYVETSGTKTLVGLNACVPKCKDDEEDPKVEGVAWNHVLDSVNYLETKVDIFDYLGTDTLLYAFGLVVRREYRGMKLGQKLLSAREPLCRALGIKATFTLFSTIASQKSAANSGFTTIISATLGELAEAGIKYPKGDKRVLKLMAKKYT